MNKELEYIKNRLAEFIIYSDDPFLKAEIQEILTQANKIRKKSNEKSRIR